MQLDTNLWHPSNIRKASNSRDVGNIKDPSPAAIGTPALSKEHQQEKAQPQQQKRQQQQDLCGKAIKVAGNEVRNMAVSVAVIQKIWWPRKVPKWPWFLLGVFRYLTTLPMTGKWPTLVICHPHPNVKSTGLKHASELGFPVPSIKLFSGRRNKTKLTVVSSEFRLCREMKKRRNSVSFRKKQWAIHFAKPKQGNFFLRNLPYLYNKYCRVT